MEGQFPDRRRFASSSSSGSDSIRLGSMLYALNGRHRLGPDAYSSVSPSTDPQASKPLELGGDGGGADEMVRNGGLGALGSDPAHFLKPSSANHVIDIGHPDHRPATKLELASQLVE